MSESSFSAVLCSEPQTRLIVVKATGAATGTPTEVFGAGVTISRTGVGVWRLTFSSSVFNYVGLAGFSFDDTTTAANVKGYTATSTPYAAATKTIDVSIWSSGFAAVDLTTAQTLTFLVAYKASNAAG
jgi:hypothetical protein